MYSFFRRLTTTLFGLPPQVSTCRFQPTCSHYCPEALKKHGLLRGLSLCLSRLLRCHPFAAGGPDPVP